MDFRLPILDWEKQTEIVKRRKAKVGEYQEYGRKLMRTIIIGFALGAMLLALGFPVEAQQAIFLVRHGETVAPKGTDLRPLSEPGQRRAVLLATLLKDAGINAIFTSDLERTVKTAEPLATSLRVEPKALAQLNVRFKPNDIDGFVNLLRSEHGRDIVLVVGHSNSVPALLKALGHPAEIKIPETDFGNLFVLIPKSEGPPILLRLRY